MSKQKRHSDTEKKAEAFDRNVDKDRNRGFANMDPDRQREIAREGGRASHGGGRQTGDRNVKTRLEEEAVEAKND